MIQRVAAAAAPAAAGIAVADAGLPQAVIANGFVHTSVRVPAAAENQAGDDQSRAGQAFGDQVRGALADLAEVLGGAGSSLEHVVKITSFLSNPRLEEYNRIYAEVFGAALPARTTVVVQDSGCALELQCVAVVAEAAGSGQIRRIANGRGMAPVRGPYPQAVVANGFVYTAGQLPAGTGTADQCRDFAGQVRQTLANLETILVEAGSSLAHIAKVTTYLTDPGQLEEYNRIYAQVLGSHLPARTSCCVGIWDIPLEIECVALLADFAAPQPGIGTLTGADIEASIARAEAVAPAVTEPAVTEPAVTEPAGTHQAGRHPAERHPPAGRHPAGILLSGTSAAETLPSLHRFTTFNDMAPAVGPFSQAVQANGFVYTTGQIPLIGSADERPVTFEGKIRQVLTNLAVVLEGAGSGLEQVLSVTTYLGTADRLHEFERVYADVFGAHMPATTALVVGIWDFEVEIQCVAILKPGHDR